MWVAILYVVIIIFANTLGAISGMGGGVIIKPLFELIQVHDIASISFYSSVAVLTMSCVSTTKQIKNGVSLNGRMAFQLSIGSIAGGLLGNALFVYLLNILPRDGYVQMIQIILTIVTLLFSYWYSSHSDWYYQYQNKWARIFTGVALGGIASLLGIGGGPINVAFLMLLFHVPIKKATVYSIVIILFSQLSKVGSILLQGQWHAFDMRILWAIIPSAVIGGLLGAQVSKKVSSQVVDKVYKGVIIFVLAVNVYNLIQVL